jgi:uncharacterized protein (DUF697 family)
MKVKREELTSAVSSALETVLVKGTNLFPKVKPDAAEIVDRVNVLTSHALTLREPYDFFDARLPVAALDRVAREQTGRARLVAATAGAGVGTAGLPGIFIDIPVLVASTVGLVRRHALTYGFTEIEENIGEPTALLVALGASLGADLAISKVVAKVINEMGLDVSTKLVERFLVQHVSEAFAARILTSWLPRAIPLAGTLTVAALDATFLTMAGRRSQSYFRDRHWLVRQQIIVGQISRPTWKSLATQTAPHLEIPAAPTASIAPPTPTSPANDTGPSE